ncbi:MAG: hypothetical protein ACTHO8_11265 [Solirubrobacterales bacterium]
MSEQEQRDLARRLADASNVLDFETALQIVQFDSAKAEELLRNREEEKKTREEFARIRAERRQALLELR